MLVLLAAAAYEAALALEWISMGSKPGDEATGQGAVTIAAFLALLTGIVATVVSRRILRRWPATLVPVVAAAYMVAHYYAFDSYYLPSLTRFSDLGTDQEAAERRAGAHADPVARLCRNRGRRRVRPLTTPDPPPAGRPASAAGRGARAPRNGPRTCLAT